MPRGIALMSGLQGHCGDLYQNCGPWTINSQHQKLTRYSAFAHRGICVAHTPV